MCVVEVHYEDLRGLYNNTTVDILIKLSFKSMNHHVNTYTNVAFVGIMVMSRFFILREIFLTVFAIL